jgi:hypothetical protein
LGTVVAVAFVVTFAYGFAFAVGVLIDLITVVGVGYL